MGGYKKNWICSCIIYAHPTRGAKRFMELWAKYMKPESNDQVAINALLQNRRMRKRFDIGFLDFHLFPPGCRALEKDFRDGLVWAHANYRRGLKMKKKFLTELGARF